MSKTVSIVIIVLIVVLGGWYLVSSGQNIKNTPASGSSTTVPSGTEASSTTSYTADEVATHNTEGSCWTIVDGSVYDLTQWIPQHPGGPQAIMSLCGHDGSDAFHAQHDHAARQENILATFKIGVLANASAAQ